MRLKSVSPTVVKGQVELDVDATVRSRESGWEFVRVLEAGGDFYGVYPRRETGNEFSYTLRYRPQRPAGAAGSPAAPSPAPESGEVAGADVPPPSPSTEARR